MSELPVDVAGVAIDPRATLVLQAINRVDGIVNAYKEYKIAQSIEETKRVACREQAKIAIRTLEEETKKYISDSNNNKEIAFKLIDTLNNTLQTRELLDENTYKICQHLIEGAIGAMK